ncbi:uncharacterized protein ACN2A1_010887 isoform 1-T1 [Glossina fuscipes fuscipes]
MTEKETIQMGDTRMQSQDAIKYLEVMTDWRLSSKWHLQYTVEKPPKVGKSLERLLSNLRGPGQDCRKLIAEVVAAIIMYGSWVWKKAHDIPSYTEDIQPAYRLCALRVCAAYRIVSEDAALAIAALTSIDLQAKERMYRAEFHSMSAEAAEQRGKQRLVEYWQERWSKVGKGRWTHRLIPDLRS